MGESLWHLRTPADVARLARVVEATRVAQAHQLNERSSRSHALVHLHLVQNAGGKVIRRHFLFVDLAGSERIERSGVEGAGKKQAVAINSSLSVLGKVIKELLSGSRHVSFRDSTLTQLLRAAFSGRSCTAVVVNIAAEEAHLDETVVCNACGLPCNVCCLSSSPCRCLLPVKRSASCMLHVTRRVRHASSSPSPAPSLLRHVRFLPPARLLSPSHQTPAVPALVVCNWSGGMLFGLPRLRT